MKTKELIEELKKLNPDKEVMIQQGGDTEYMIVHGVKEIQVSNEDGEDVDETGVMNIVGIQLVCETLGVALPTKSFDNFKNFAENILEQSAVAVAKKKKNVR